MKKSKWCKPLSLLLTVIMFLSAVPLFSSPASAAEYTGTVNGTISWTLDTESGELQLSGKGAMSDYTGTSDIPWYAYRSYIKTVTVGTDISSLGAHSFYSCDALENVYLPDNLKTIGDKAFYGCTSLKNIDLPAKLTAIGNHAFYSCSALTEIIIPDTVTTLGSYAFDLCGALKRAELPDKLTIINSYVFENCVSLEDVGIPSGVKSIGTRAFYGCSSLKNVSLPASVTFVDTYAFAYCTALKEIDFSLNMSTIGSFAFIGCSALEEMVLPDKITVINASAFSNCTSLRSIKFPKALKTVGASAFAYCTALEAAELPDTVTTLGASAFKQCTALKNIHIPANITALGEYVFYKCAAEELVFPAKLKTVGNYAFSGCAVKYLDIPATVTSIGAEAFSKCTQLACVDLGAALKSLSANAFNGCTALKNIKIPTTVTSIKSNALASTALKNIYYGGTETQWAAVTVDAASKKAVDAAELHFESFGLHDQVTEVAEPTCTEDGYVRQYCKDCGISFSEEIIAARHRPVSTDEILPTCEEAGATAGLICEECGEMLVSPEIIPAYGHSFSEYIIETAPTCETDGISKAVCDMCDAEDVKVTAATGHADADDDGYCDICGENICGHDDFFVRNAVAPDCVNAGYTGDMVCAKCLVTLKAGETTAPLGHDYTEEIVYPTCTEDGYTVHTCTVCSDSFTDDFTQAVGHMAPFMLLSLDADTAESTDCMRPVYVEAVCCVFCGTELVPGYEIPAPGHDFGEWTVLSEPTYTEYGVQSRTCSVCGEIETRTFGELLMPEIMTEPETEAYAGDDMELFALTDEDLTEAFAEEEFTAPAPAEEPPVPETVQNEQKSPVAAFFASVTQFFNNIANFFKSLFKF